MGLRGLLFQKGYLFLHCMYILKTSKLLREEWREKKRCIALNQLLSQRKVFPQSEPRCSSFVLVRPGGQHHAGCARFFLYFTQMSHSFSEDA